MFRAHILLLLVEDTTIGEELVAAVAMASVAEVMRPMVVIVAGSEVGQARPSETISKFHRFLLTARLLKVPPSTTMETGQL